MNDEDPRASHDREQWQAAERANQREDDEDHGEQEPEPSEEDLALRGLDREHVDDYLAIKHAVARTDLALRLVELAVRVGIADRT